MYLYEIDNQHDFNPDPDGFDTDEQQLTAGDVEERIDAILRGWGWTEEKRDDALYGVEGVIDEDLELAWQADTELAFQLACNAPSGTPLSVFTAVLEARGWPRTPIFQ